MRLDGEVLSLDFLLVLLSVAVLGFGFSEAHLDFPRVIRRLLFICSLGSTRAVKPILELVAQVEIPPLPIDRASLFWVEIWLLCLEIVLVEGFASLLHLLHDGTFF